MRRSNGLRLRVKNQFHGGSPRKGWGLFQQEIQAHFITALSSTCIKAVQRPA